MTQTIKGDLILTKNTEFTESIVVEGNIKGRFNLKVAGNINAGNIDAGDIDAWDIDAGNIVAWNIDAGNINAGSIICEERTKKTIKSTTKCRIYIKNKSQIERKIQDDN